MYYKCNFYNYNIKFYSLPLKKKCTIRLKNNVNVYFFLSTYYLEVPCF
jgi:hypothetical protein